MINNFRDLGGLNKKSGQAIPCGMLYRSADLHEALPEDLEGITAVIDLRTATERNHLPDRVPDTIAYYTIPIFDEATAGITREKTLNAIPDMVPLYRKMIVSCQANIQNVLSIVFSHDYSSGGILWHCTAGKDRCGVITAYVLSALGVSKETIMDDYMKSSESCTQEADAVLSQLAGLNLSKADLERIRDVYLVKPEYLQAAFSEMSFEENPQFQNIIFGRSASQNGD